MEKDVIRLESLPNARAVPPALLWTAILAGFAITHLAADRVHAGIVHLLALAPEEFTRRVAETYPDRDLAAELMAEAVVPLKSLVFLISLIVLLLPVLYSVREAWPCYAAIPWRKHAVRAALVCLALACLNFPINNIFILDGTFGLPWARMSLDPFAEPAGLHNRRLLPAALAHFLQLKGVPLYALFNTFGIWVVVVALSVFFERRLSRATLEVRGWHLLSIATSAFVISQLQGFGLADHWIFWLILAMLSFPFSLQAQMSLVALALMTHEAAVFVLGPVLLFGLRTGRERITVLSLLPLFVGIWVLSHGGDLQAVQSEDNVAGLMQAWLADPGWGLFGVFMAFKGLWIFVPWALVLLVRARRYNEALAILAVLAGVLAMVFNVRDTSRLAGYMFPAILASFVAVVRQVRIPEGARIVSALLALNLLIPSFWVGVQPFRLQLGNGLYAVATDLVGRLFGLRG